MKDDIVKRLRCQEDWPPSGVMLEEAANEIKRLRDALVKINLLVTELHTRHVEIRIAVSDIAIAALEGYDEG